MTDLTGQPFAAPVPPPYGVNLSLFDVWQIASRALKEVELVAAEIKRHELWCERMREADREARDADREAANKWRDRIEKQIGWFFAVTWGLAGTTIVLLLGIVAWLLTHGGPKFGG